MQPAENHYIKAIKSPSTCLLRKNSPKQYIRPTINGNLRGLHHGENVAWGYWGRLRIPTETNKPKPNGKKITPEIRQFLAKGAAKNWYFHKRWLNRKHNCNSFGSFFPGGSICFSIFAFGVSVDVSRYSTVHGRMFG